MNKIPDTIGCKQKHLNNNILNQEMRMCTGVWRYPVPLVLGK